MLSAGREYRGPRDSIYLNRPPVEPQLEPPLDPLRVRLERLAGRMVRPAAQLAYLVHHEHTGGQAKARREIGTLLDGYSRGELYALVVVLGAMVDVDKTTDELLAWVEPPPPRTLPSWGASQVAPHGSHAAFNRHKDAGEDPCDPCVVGERTYQRERGRRRRSAARSA